MLQVCINQLLKYKDLTAEQCKHAMQEILHDATDVQIAAFLVLLRAKGETAEEVEGIVTALRSNMVRIDIDDDVLNIVGTGGDGANTVNISTAASILSASCGAKVAKHGNRAVSSQCGSSNVLEALGLNLNCDAKQVIRCIEKAGIGFCYAPRFHPAMAKVKEVRSALGVRTVFNMVGPLVNPAQAQYYLMGVYNEKILRLMADTLSRLGVKRAMVVHSQGLDELSLLGPATMIEIDVSGLTECTFDPRHYGFSYSDLSSIQGGDAEYNATILLETFNGKKGPVADTIIINAGVALYVAEKVDSIEEGIAMARNSLFAGHALETLEQFVAVSQE